MRSDGAARSRSAAPVRAAVARQVQTRRLVSEITRPRRCGGRHVRPSTGRRRETAESRDRSASVVDLWQGPPDPSLRLRPSLADLLHNIWARQQSGLVGWHHNRRVGVDRTGRMDRPNESAQPAPRPLERSPAHRRGRRGRHEVITRAAFTICSADRSNTRYRSGMLPDWPNSSTPTGNTRAPNTPASQVR